MAVDDAHRRNAPEGAGYKGFVRSVHLRQLEVPQLDRDSGAAAQVDHVSPCDAVKTIRPARRAHRPGPYHEKICGIAAGNEAGWIKHQRLIGTFLDSLQQGSDQIQPTVRV